ncbi:MAG: hypothetical protein EBU33_03015 [Sphingobacteriia bacterium]|nr:hypothetical protein [Sphingobacteriia bacterium]
MAIEIKELVIRTILDKGTATEERFSSEEVRVEILKQLELFRVDIIDQCIEAVSEGIKRQKDR